MQRDPVIEKSVLNFSQDVKFPLEQVNVLNLLFRTRFIDHKVLSEIEELARYSKQLISLPCFFKMTIAK